MDNTTIIAIVVVVVLLALLYFSFRGSNAPVVNIPAVPTWNKATVNYFGDLDCPNIGLYPNLNLEQCKAKAESMGAKAFNHDGFNGCVIRGCKDGAQPNRKDGVNFGYAKYPLQ